MHKATPNPNDTRPAPPAPAAYDWSRLGRHRFRTPGSVVIDLPFPAGPTQRLWVATVWPDPRVLGGWGRFVWQLDPSTGRGWWLPQQLAAGDVIEFGADDCAGPRRWYGIMDSYEFDRWMTVQGPYPDPAAAYAEAQRLLALERFLPPLQAEPPRTMTPCVRTRHPRRRGG